MIRVFQVADERSGNEEPEGSFLVPDSITQINFQKISAQNQLRIEPGRWYKVSVCSVIEMIGASKDIVGGESVPISDTFAVVDGGRLQKVSGNRGGGIPIMEQRIGPKTPTRNRKGAPPVPRH